MKKWLFKNKIAVAMGFLGSISGYLYWQFIGCESGSCAITSVWWRATIYGAILGWLIGSLFKDTLIKKKMNHN